MNKLMNTALDAVHLAKGLAADAAPEIMNSVKNATLAGVTLTKDAVNSTEIRENVHAGLMAAPEIMNNVKNATLAGITLANDAVQSTELRENVQAGLMAAAAKTQEFVEAAPEAAGQVNYLRILAPSSLLSSSFMAVSSTQELINVYQSAEWAAANPGTAALLAVGAVGVGLVAAPMAAAAPIMAATGFSSVGPVAGTQTPIRTKVFKTKAGGNANTYMPFDIGSVAAGVQAAAGNVVACGLYATVQSAAMGGYGVAAISGAVQGLGAAVISGVGGALAYQKAKEGDEATKSD
ncbi:hypothetical protein N0V82_001330 [Gnomoniopsis sp. IMI 355080]|nr:hypothetical protein N0V82_001330 [Gnomoniopsis sp. IMI 355080]